MAETPVANAMAEIGRLAHVWAERAGGEVQPVAKARMEPGPSGSSRGSSATGSGGGLDSSGDEGGVGGDIGAGHSRGDG
eukprot:3563738-Prorocentrum_lima.AAC.1